MKPGDVVIFARSSGKKHGARRLPFPPPGAFCTHRRMRFASCGADGGMCRKPCRVECPDCGLSWMFGEGIYG